MRKVLAVFPLFFLFSVTASASDDAVQRFHRLETRLAEALQAHDTGTLESLLRPDYSLTVAAAGGLVKVDHATWLRNAVTTRVLHEFRIHELVVREYGRTAVVSVLYTGDATVDGVRRTTHYFLTDIWVESDGQWRIAARHSSRPEGSGPPSENEPGL